MPLSRLLQTLTRNLQSLFYGTASCLLCSCFTEWERLDRPKRATIPSRRPNSADLNDQRLESVFPLPSTISSRSRPAQKHLQSSTGSPEHKGTEKQSSADFQEPGDARQQDLEKLSRCVPVTSRRQDAAKPIRRAPLDVFVSFLAVFLEFL